MTNNHWGPQFVKGTIGHNCPHKRGLAGDVLLLYIDGKPESPRNLHSTEAWLTGGRLWREAADSSGAAPSAWDCVGGRDLLCDGLLLSIWEIFVCECVEVVRVLFFLYIGRSVMMI